MLLVFRLVVSVLLNVDVDGFGLLYVLVVSEFACFVLWCFIICFGVVIGYFLFYYLVYS